MTKFADILMRGLNQAGVVAQDAWTAPTNRIGSIGAAAALASGADYQYNPKNRVHMLTNVPLMKDGAMTLGNYQLYGRGLPPDYPEHGHTVQQHEDQHVIQSNLLGPLYLPFALAGMATGLIRDHNDHGPHAFSESGPLQDPPQPWPKKWW